MNLLDQKIEQIIEQVGDAHVMGAVSGGVDSSLLAVLLTRALGAKFHPVFVDTGLMRHRESETVVQLLRSVGVKPKVVRAAPIFLKNLARVRDPEKKRKVIGKTFIKVFEQYAKGLRRVEYLAQGTIYPDVLESRSASGHTIKSHHNVGGLPRAMKLKLVEPLRDLYKNDVRSLGVQLGLPGELLDRHPFPGPGLAVRIAGEVTKQRLDLLRRVDHIYIEELKAKGLYAKIWQAFAVLLPINTVGIRSNTRTYEAAVVLRAVNSTDGMSADWFGFDKAVLSEISARITAEVKGVNRIVYDVSSKPPATIEWE